MLNLKTVTLNNKQNRKLLQSDLWSSSHLISELDYSIMTVWFSWKINEYPFRSLPEQKIICLFYLFIYFKSLFPHVCWPFVQFSIFLGVNELYQNILIKLDYIVYHNVSSSFNTVFVERWLSRAIVLWKSAMFLSLFWKYFLYISAV